MSDSDWEVLSSDDGGATPRRHSPTSATASDGAAGGDSGRRKAAHDPLQRLNRNNILTPLCLTLNQTGTRIGVGHTTGFLVFRVMPAVPSGNSQAPAAAAAGAAPASARTMPARTHVEHRTVTEPLSGVGALPSGLPAQSQLHLDPQYNLDLLTFSHIRERMRQEQEERLRLRHAQHLHEPATSHASPVTPTEADIVSAETMSPTAARGRRADVGAPAASIPFADDGADIFSDEDDDSADALLERGFGLNAETDLGSFLTTAGRAFAQMKRNAPHRPGATAAVLPTTSKPAPDSASSPAPAHEEPTVPGDTPAPRPDSLTGDSGVEAEATAAAAAVATPSVFSEDPSYSPRFILNPTPVLEWGKDEDIDVDPRPSTVRASRTAAAHMADEGKPQDNNDTSAVDAPAAQAAPEARVGTATLLGATSAPRTPLISTGSNVDAAVADASATPVPGELDADDDSVGFTGGGVAVMAFLYEQPWVALVGGGPTPMGPPNVVELVRDGERRHTLRTPDPIVRLFLDARLLFVLTTAELRLYTNPMEPSWTCLRQSLRLPAAVASRYADLLHRPPTSFSAPDAAVSNTSGAASTATAAGVPLHAWEKPSAASASSQAREGSAAAAAHGATPLPVVPVVVDYARNLVLLPAGEEGTGFALHRYVSGPEVRHSDPLAHDAPSNAASGLPGVSVGGSGGSAAATGRTTAFCQHIATQAAAHRNPLFSLALFVGWPSAITRLTASNAEDGAVTASASSTAYSVTGDSPISDGGGLVTLVAASSEYATRLTLWMLQHTRAGAARDERHAALYDATAGDSVFVLLREFRVGVRLAAPRLVMATLPSVSRYIARGQAAFGGTDGTSHTILSAGAPSASASALRFSGGASPTPSSASHTGTVTSWASEAVAASAAGPAVVQHLQFIGNGAYLLCIHGADTISIFSTSARESEQEARNVCRDRVAAEQNRYSRLTVMKEYLPRALANRLEAYTRQAWSSCSGRLPVADRTFLPRWIYVRGQDAISVTAAGGAAASSSAVSATSASPPRVPTTSTPTAGSAPPPPAHAVGGGRRFFGRFTSLVTPRTAAASAAPTPAPSSEPTRLAGLRGSASAAAAAARGDDGEAEPSASLPPAGAAPRRHAAAGTAPWAAASLPPLGPSPAGSAVVWGTPLADLPQCIQVWSPPPHLAGNSHAAASASLVGPASARHPPIVLNCATCEGAFVNIVLFADEGELVTSQALPYVTS